MPFQLEVDFRRVQGVTLDECAVIDEFSLSLPMLPNCSVNLCNLDQIRLNLNRTFNFVFFLWKTLVGLSKAGTPQNSPCG